METLLICSRCRFPAEELDSAGCCETCGNAKQPESSSGVKLRDYQIACIDNTFEQFQTNNSTLIVKPTGTGKTVTFAEIIRRWERGRVLVMAHRDELIRQAADKIHRVAGEECDIEMGEERADRSNMWRRRKVIVTSVQTMSREKRMRRFDPNDFGLLIVDEAHHCQAPSYLAVIEHFRRNPNLKLLGVTATPDRADERALGAVFESVAFDYGIVDAIDDGWLVPIEQQLVYIEGLDLSRCRTTAGDLNQGDLSRIMEEEERCHEVASATMQAATGQTLIFAASVRQAELISDIINRHQHGQAEWICGDSVKCPIDTRRDTLRRFGECSFQYLVNCAILLEGYDEPEIRTIAMARPTKSRSLYAQVAGRGTRPLTGLVDGLETAAERRTAIASSDKKALLLLDFVGNSGKHKLVHSGDILGGNYDDAIVAMATKTVQQASTRGERTNMLEALRQAEKEHKENERRRRQRVVADAKMRMKSVNPFDVFDLTATREPEYKRGRPPAPWMKKILDKAKVPFDNLTYTEAEQLAKETLRRWENNLCTYKQAATLKKFGFDGTERTFEEASALIDQIAKSGWKLRGHEFN